MSYNATTLVLQDVDHCGTLPLFITALIVVLLIPSYLIAAFFGLVTSCITSLMENPVDFLATVFALIFVTAIVFIPITAVLSGLYDDLRAQRYGRALHSACDMHYEWILALVVRTRCFEWIYPLSINGASVSIGVWYNVLRLKWEKGDMEMKREY